ncbi:MAG: O-antigen ligase family protein [Phycisphaerae bacterium]|nr:O-antigen ligase family protein [Phycisphaerae bacterium]
MAMLVLAWLHGLLGLPRMGRTLRFYFLDDLVNPIRWVLPAVMLFDGARTRNRMTAALIFALIIPTYYGYKVSRTAPMSNLTAGGYDTRARWRIGKQVGMHANSISMTCATGFWAAWALGSTRRNKWRFPMIALMLTFCFLGVGLCQSRAGYWAMLGVGGLFAVFLYRYLFLTFPIMLALIPIYFPGLMSRFSLGTNIETASGEVIEDEDVKSAGRSLFWPIIIEDIWTSPVLGHGRRAIFTRPTRGQISAAIGSCPEHPHNAYLEQLHDGGIVTLAITLTLFLSAMGIGMRLCLDRSDPLYRAVGGACLAAVATLMIMSYSGQSLFPKENNQITWYFMALALRAWVERAKGPMAFADGSQQGMPFYGTPHRAPQNQLSFSPPCR